MNVNTTTSEYHFRKTPPPVPGSMAERTEIAAGSVDAPPRTKLFGQSPGGLFLQLFSSFGLAITLIVLLGILTFLGTIAQTEMGIHAAQKRYFESWFLVQWVGLPIPLPGGFLVMSLLTLNLIVGGIVRMRWDVKRIGILVTHAGIALLFISGLVKHMFAYEGSLALYEGEKAAFFQSYYDWDLTVTEQLPNGKWKETIVPGEQLSDLRGSRSRTFVREDLPFDLTVSHWMPNSKPIPVRPGQLIPAQANGVGLVSLPRNPTAEANLAGALLKIRDKQTGDEREEVLYGWHDNVSTQAWRPIRYETGDKTYAIDLRHRLYPLPFQVQLEDFRRELYPGTSMPKSFESDVLVRRDANDEKQVRIWMNNPLRRDGFVLFQSNWGPQRGGGDGPMYSIFTVVHNPSDQWPLISCIIIAIGLIWHFGVMLARYIQKEARWNV